MIDTDPFRKSVFCQKYLQKVTYTAYYTYRKQKNRKGQNNGITESQNYYYY